MLARYKEIYFGIALGIGALLIDASMHSSMDRRPFFEELVHPGSTMLFYRGLYLVYGAAIGGLLWQRNKREREFRRLAEIYERFHREVADPAFLIHAKCEELLWLDDSELPAKAKESVRFVYDKVRTIESLAKERLAIPTSSSNRDDAAEKKENQSQEKGK